MRTSARTGIRTAAVLGAGAVLTSTLPLMMATSAQATEPPAPADQVTAPATPSPASTTAAKTPTKKQIRAQKLRAKRLHQKKRAITMRKSLVRIGLRQRGDQYVAGAAGPNRFDCSGFTQWVYKKATGKYLPHYSGAQMNTARRVGVRNLEPGDLLFFGPGGSQHVSMYIGHGKMVHATNPRTDVRVDSIHNGYWRSRFAGAGRILKF